MKQRVTTEEYKEKLKYALGDRIECAQEYVKASIAIKHKCNVCSTIVKIRPDQLLIKKTCPNCTKLKKEAEAKAFAINYVNRLKEACGDKYTLLTPYIKSSIKVKYKCNMCGNIQESYPMDLLRGHGCQGCHIIKMKQIQTKPKEVYDKRYQEKFGDKISIIGEWVKASSKVLHRCNVCNTTFTAMPTQVLKHTYGCPTCATNLAPKERRRTTEEFIEELKALGNATYLPIEPYTTSETKINFQCSICGHINKVTPESVLSGRSCPICVRKAQGVKQSKSHSQFVQEIKEIHGDTLTIIGTYKRSAEKVKCRCNKCLQEWDSNPGSLLSGRGCPKCLMNYKELELKNILSQNSVSYEYNKPMPGCFYKNKNNCLRADFIIHATPKIYVEYDGIGHFLDVRYGDLETTRKRDTIKNNFIKDEGGILIRVSDSPYKTDKHISVNMFEEVVRDSITDTGLNPTVFLKYDYNR